MTADFLQYHSSDILWDLHLRGVSGTSNWTKFIHQFHLLASINRNLHAQDVRVWYLGAPTTFKISRPLSQIGRPVYLFKAVQNSLAPTKVSAFIWKATWGGLNKLDKVQKRNAHLAISR